MLILGLHVVEGVDSLELMDMACVYMYLPPAGLGREAQLAALRG